VGVGAVGEWGSTVEMWGGCVREGATKQGGSVRHDGYWVEGEEQEQGW
jgi:hypothetical protein